jgi:hypothetical protein
MLGSICLGANLLGRKGLKLGKVRCLVADKDKVIFTHLVIEITRGGFCKKVVEAADIKWLSPQGDTVQLGLFSGDLEDLPDYLEHDYSDPDTSYAEVPYTLLASGGIFPWVFNRTYFSPVPETLTTSEGSTLVRQSFREKVNLPENSLQFHQNTSISGEDYKKIGYLKSLNLEFFSGKIKSLTLKRGFLHEDTSICEWETVKKVTKDNIIVSLV